MIERRKFAELGGADHGWLKAKHHFSFASYYDPRRMGWGNLRVWNDDEIAAEPVFRPTRTPTWRSSPTCARARSRTRIRWATRAAPRPATCR